MRNSEFADIFFNTITAETTYNNPKLTPTPTYDQEILTKSELSGKNSKVLNIALVEFNRDNPRVLATQISTRYPNRPRGKLTFLTPEIEHNGRNFPNLLYGESMQ